MEKPSEPAAIIRNGNHGVAQAQEVGFIQDGPVAPQILPAAENTMNGSIQMPPQQVYVQSAMPAPVHHDMAGLESQFQSLGMNATTPEGPPQTGENGQAEEGDNDEEESEENPVKLFVGQVRNNGCSSEAL